MRDTPAMDGEAGGRLESAAESDQAAGAQTPATESAPGEGRAGLPFGAMVVLGVLGGAAFGMGACFLTVVVAGGELHFGLSQLLGGLAFSLGLMLVVLGGGELFGANTALASAWMAGRTPTDAMLRTSAAVLIGNLIGSIALVWLVFSAGQYMLGERALGASALAIAISKCSMPFSVVVARGVLGNGLICFAVWLCRRARSTADKVFAIVLPATAFAACGFEHCVADMYFVSMGLAIQWTSAIGLGDPASLNIVRFLFGSLLPASLGNIIGGIIAVGGLHWIAHILPRLEGPRRRPRSGRRESLRSAGAEGRPVIRPRRDRPYSREE